MFVVIRVTGTGRACGQGDVIWEEWDGRASVVWVVECKVTGRNAVDIILPRLAATTAAVATRK